MRRVFLSFLGTNDYKPCIYTRDGYASGIVRFVQEATLGLCCADWMPEDRIVLFTTLDARERNWRDDGHVDPKTGKRFEREGLCRRIERMHLKAVVERVDISEGKSEAEIWEIFGKVFEKLADGDEVVFDITHAFRSIPMLAIVILNYAKIVKKIKIIGIYYGAFEVLGSTQEAEKKPPEERLVPILDLTAFDQLLDWSIAIDRFIKAGDGSYVAALARGGLRMILAQTKGRDRNAAAIRDVGETLDSFCKIMATCRESRISPTAAKLKRQMEHCGRADLLPPFRPLFKMLQTEMEPFMGDNRLDGIAAATWCINHNLIQQGATILRELVVDHLITLREGNTEDPIARELAACAMNLAHQDMHREESDRPGQEIPAGCGAYLQICSQTPNLVKIWMQLAQLRNDLNHAGHVNHPRKAGAFSKQLPPIVKSLKEEFTGMTGNAGTAQKKA